MKRAATEPNDLPEGTRLLDRYTILDRVGSGGMASIYRATDERLDRVVCVKLLRLILEGSGRGTGRNVYRASYAHFLKEALALSKLQHPNTLRIYDFGYLGDGSPFQISEFLDGGNLETQVRSTGPFTPEEALAVLERIVGAIAEAHSHGIIHRDIKPSNILFSRVGEVLMPKLADFGIAQSKLRRGLDDEAPASEEHSDLVSTVALFSPRWAAPEQLAGSAEGPGTDVYALGLVTAYMLTGRVAFADTDVRAHFGDRIRGDAFVASRLDDLGLATPIRDVLLQALTADPTTRMASPEAFFDAIRAAIDARVPRGLPTGAFRRPFESITLLTDPGESDSGHDDLFVTPAERTIDLGTRKVRLVEINEKLDVLVTGEHDLRFRVTILPSGLSARSNITENPAGFSINVKGLNCFVTKENGRPTPAIVAQDDGAASFVNGDKTRTGTLRWSFGTPTRNVGPGAGRVFAIDGIDLVVTYAEASQAVALDLGPDREVVVMCKR